MSTIDPLDYIVSLDPSGQLLATTAGRKALCESDPLAFAILYLAHHLTDEQGAMSFAEPHLEWADLATTWAQQQPSRHAFVAPRNLGKSTWWFLILPLWAACFGHVKFIAAFADSADQARNHLATFRDELRNNELLRADFAKLCEPAKDKGKALADREDKYKAASAFVFVARGIDSSNLGLKDGNLRPDLIILDDLEPDASNYSLGLKEKRLHTLLSSVLGMNTQARVVLSGTVTMAQSIVHDLVKSIEPDETPAQWITELKPPFSVHHHKPIVADERGTERSIWPANARFGLDYMHSIEGTTVWYLNYLNLPLAGNGELWTPASFAYDGTLSAGGLLLSIDPATTSKRSSDFTALALVGVDRIKGKAFVEECWALKRSPEQLRAFIFNVCENYPVARVLIETNQGGDTWRTLLAGLPVPLSCVHQTKSKEARAARVFTLYDTGKVFHKKKLVKLEEQMCSFPKGLHDDMVDAVGSAVIYFVDLIKASKSSALPVSNGSYLAA